MLKSFPFVGGSNKEHSTIIDIQRTINWYVNVDQMGKKSPQLIAVPGIQTRNRLQVSPDALPVRGMLAYGNFMYIIAGDKFYRMDSAEVITEIDSFGTTIGYVSIATNGKQVIFVDGQAGYVHPIGTTTLTPISSPNFPSEPLQVVYFGGRFAVCKGGSNKFFISALGDALTWNDENYAFKEASDDLFAGISTISNRLLLFGTQSIEFWIDAGDVTFPFRRDNNILPKFGCSATATIAQGGIGDGKTALFFLGGDSNGVGSIMMTTGGNPITISTEALDEEIQNYENVSDAWGYAYKQDGHYFYMILFPTANKCWCYDASVGTPEMAWHEREMIDNTRFVGQTHEFFSATGKHYVGDYRKATLYEMSKKFYMFDTENIRCTRICRYGSDGVTRRQIREFSVDFQHGVGNNKNPGADPFAYLSISRDDGATFGSMRRAILGRMGRREVRTRWLGLGTYRSFVFKVVAYANVARTVAGAAIDMEVLDT